MTTIRPSGPASIQRSVGTNGTERWVPPLRVLADVLRYADAVGPAPEFDIPPGSVDAIVGLAVRHRVTHPFAAAVRSGPRLETVSGALRPVVQRLSLTCLHQASVAQEVVEMLNGIGARPLLLKGLAVSALAYRDYVARGPGDIDVLVDPSRLEDSLARLVAGGAAFRGSALHTENILVQGVPVEVHHRLDPNPHLLQIPHTDLWARRTLVNVGGSDLPTLSLSDALLLASCHGSRDGWPILRYALDMAFLASRFTPSGLDEAERQASRYGVSTPLAVGLLLAARILGQPERGGTRARAIANRSWAAIGAGRHLRASRLTRDRVVRNTLHLASLEPGAAAWGLGRSIRVGGTGARRSADESLITAPWETERQSPG